MDSVINFEIFVFFVFRFSGIVVVVWEGYVEGFDSGCYGVGSVYVIIGVVFGVCIVDDIEVFFFVNLVSNVLIVGLEGRDNVEGLVVFIVVRCNRVIVDYDIRMVDMIYSYGNIRYVFVVIG